MHSGPPRNTHLNIYKAENAGSDGQSTGFWLLGTLLLLEQAPPVFVSSVWCGWLKVTVFLHLWTKSNICSFNLSTHLTTLYYVPGTVLDMKDPSKKQTKQANFSWSLLCQRYSVCQKLYQALGTWQWRGQKWCHRDCIPSEMVKTITKTAIWQVEYYRPWSGSIGLGWCVKGHYA